MYVLRRNEDGAYVARRGSRHSYTRKFEQAQTFDTLQGALADACGNEKPCMLADAVGRI